MTEEVTFRGTSDVDFKNSDVEWEGGNPLIISLSVTPKTKYLPPRESVQFLATASYADASSLDVTALCAWSSSNPDVAMVSETGLAKSLKAGITAIRATYKGFEDSVLVIVVNSLQTGTPKIVSFATQQGVYRNSAYKAKRYKYPKQSLSVIKVLASNYPVIVDIIYPKVPKATTVRVTSEDPQRILPVLADCCDISINCYGEVSALFLASTFEEIPL